MNNEIISILQRAAEKAGVKRTRYEDQKVPASIDNVCVLPFFGDLRSTCVLSSFLLKRYREESKGSKFSLCVAGPVLSRCSRMLTNIGLSSQNCTLCTLTAMGL